MDIDRPTARSRDVASRRTGAGQDDDGNAPGESQARKRGRATGYRRHTRQATAAVQTPGRRPGSWSRALWLGVIQKRSSRAQRRSDGQDVRRTNGRGAGGATQATRAHASQGGHSTTRGGRRDRDRPTHRSRSPPYTALRRSGVNTAPNGDADPGEGASEPWSARSGHVTSGLPRGGRVAPAQAFESFPRSGRQPAPWVRGPARSRADPRPKC